MPDQADREPWNHLRVDLYRHLYPSIQEQDQKSGAHGFNLHWDDPEAEWDQGNPVQDSWDKIGLDPIYQELFYVIETKEGEDLAILESLDDLTNPLKAPPAALPLIAKSLGYDLSTSISVEMQRVALIGLIAGLKARGQFVGFKIAYRLIGFDVVNVFPLWKKSIHEALSEYSRTRYVTTPVTAPIGAAGQVSFAGRLAAVPVQPGTAIFTAGTVHVRDDENGNLIGPTTETGTINYQTGDYVLELAAPAGGPVTVTYNQVTSEFPFHAARIDIEINISPGGGPIPLVDEQVIGNILTRMEETRPVHVLLRSLALVVEIDDVFGADGHSGATDQAACVTALLDHRDGFGAFPGPPGRDFLYLLDEALSGEDDLNIEEIVSGSRTLLVNTQDDRAPIVCPLDTLIITQTPPGTSTFW